MDATLRSNAPYKCCSIREQSCRITSNLQRLEARRATLLIFTNDNATMKIFRVRPDVNNYQYFMLEDDVTGVRFDCSRIADTWKPPPVFIFNPKAKRGHFFKLWSTAAFIMDSPTVGELQDLLEMSG